MVEMIQVRKEELEKRGVSGFTLMEMLIVIAIIAILVAIAIPVFTSQLASANAETDAANIRAGYATASATVLTNGVTATTVYYLNSDGTVTTTASGTYACKGASTSVSNQGQYIGGTAITSIAWTSGKHIKYTWNGTTMSIATV